MNMRSYILKMTVSILSDTEWCKDDVRTWKTNLPLVPWRFSYGFYNGVSLL